MRLRLFSLVAVTALLARSATALPVTLSLEPAGTAGVQAGDIVSLNLYARSIPPGQGVLAIQTFITFDPTLLSIVDGLGNAVSAITPGPGWDFVFANDVGPVPAKNLLPGELFFSAGSFSGLATDLLVASFSVKALDNFVVTSLTLPNHVIDRPPFLYQNRVSDLLNLDITGGLDGASLYGTQVVAIPEPLGVSVLGLGLGMLIRRRRPRC